MNSSDYKDNVSNNGQTANNLTSNNRQDTSEKADHTPDNLDLALDQLINEPEVERRPTLFNKLLEKKAKIQAAFDAKKSVKQIVNALNNGGLEINEATFKSYWYDIKAGYLKPRRGNKKNKSPAAPVSEPETAGENDPVPDEKPAPVFEEKTVSDFGNSDVKNSAGNEPETGEVAEGETVEELTTEPAEVEPGTGQDQAPKCLACGETDILWTNPTTGKTHWICPNRRTAADKSKHDYFPA